MRTFISIYLLFIALSFVNAQENCDTKLQEAQSYLETNTDIIQEELTEISTYLADCFGENGLSYYVRGLLEMREKPTADYASAFGYFKAAAATDFTRAKTYLGYFYKNGWAGSIDFAASLDWIQQAADEGDDNAVYTLGYYYLKGLGGLSPDYEKAIACFQQSALPMAKHWLAFCTYFGLGTDKATADAEEVLENTDTPNSEELLAFLENVQAENLDFETFLDKKNSIPTNFFNINPDQKLYGDWLEKDWKNERLIRKLPVVLTANQQDTDVQNFSIEIAGVQYPFTIATTGDLLTENLIVAVPAPFADKTLHYRIKEINLQKQPDTGIYNIVLTTWIEEYQEDGPPISLRLYSPEAMARKINRSTRFFPTAFSESFSFSFSLEHPSELSISLYSLDGSPLKTQTYGILPPGNHELQCVAPQIIPQEVIAQLSINNSKITRQLIKRN